MADQCETSTQLDAPADTSLPFVTYGALRPGELAFDQVSRYVQSCDEVSVAGHLYVRDGLPLLELAMSPADNSVPANLLTFRARNRRQAYEAICRFEPRGHYQWAVTQLEKGSKANILVGVLPEQGSEPAEELPWSSFRDPVFEHGLHVVHSVADASAQLPFKSAPSDSFEWERFFTLQMAYLLLWSAVERFCALAYGPARNPMSKLRKMARDKRIADVIRTHVCRSDTVSDVRGSRADIRLDSADPEACLLYYYQVRNNLSHRGKGAWRDGEKVRHSLAELLAIFEASLSFCRAQAQSQANQRLP